MSPPPTPLPKEGGMDFVEALPKEGAWVGNDRSPYPPREILRVSPRPLVLLRFSE